MRLPAATFALIQPLAKRSVAAFPVAATASGDFVLEPAWPTLDTRDQVFSGRRYQVHFQVAPAPHALATVALQDDLAALLSIHGCRTQAKASADELSVKRDRIELVAGCISQTLEAAE